MKMRVSLKLARKLTPDEVTAVVCTSCNITRGDLRRKNNQTTNRRAVWYAALERLTGQTHETLAKHCDVHSNAFKNGIRKVNARNDLKKHVEDITRLAESAEFVD